VLKRSPSDNPIRLASLSTIFRKSRSDNIFVTCSNCANFSAPSSPILFLKELAKLPMFRLHTESLAIRLLNTLVQPRPDNEFSWRSRWTMVWFHSTAQQSIPMLSSLRQLAAMLRWAMLVFTFSKSANSITVFVLRYMFLKLTLRDTHCCAQ